MKTNYERWKVILGAVGFLLLMGLAGREDYQAQVVIDQQPVVVVAEVAK